ncbi:hypothetical protein [Actinospica robiniae]|uniref:hypothetical protein n=1 Tax=Actinospica robiniae TaxID=304901 RepID=UPI0003FCFCE1|nr:hypothetical protein [Actinospica robiniae]
MRWQDQIPNIDNVRWALLWVHNVEAEFHRDAANLRDEVRAHAELRAAYQAAYDYVLAYDPTLREWASATDTPFCTREQLREYLQAFYDYVFGDRPEPIYPPPNDEPCPHEKNKRGQCVLAVAEREAQERNDDD